MCVQKIKLKVIYEHYSINTEKVNGKSNAAGGRIKTVTGHVCVNSDEISKIGAEQRGKIVIYSRETERGA